MHFDFLKFSRIFFLILVSACSISQAAFDVNCESCLSKNQMHLAQVSCQQLIDQSSCQQLIQTEPQLQSKIRSCSENDICKHAQAKEIEGLFKNCFNGAGDFGVDVRKIFTETLPQSWSCAKDSTCRSQKTHQAMYSMIFLNPGILASTMVQSTDEYIELFKKASHWMKVQGWKWDCFSVEAKTEMLCYAVTSIVAPASAAKIVSKLPTIRLLLKEKNLKVVNEIEQAEERSLSDAPANKKSLRASAQARESFKQENRNIKKLRSEHDEYKKYALMTSEENSKAGVLLFKSENSILKKMNTAFNGDKDLATAFNNNYKKRFDQKIQELRKKYPNAEFIVSYDDYKGVRAAVLTKGNTQIERDLMKTFDDINQEFSSELKQRKIVRQEDRPDLWFRGAVGTDAEEVNFASRMARTNADKNELGTFKNVQSQATFLREDIQNSYQKLKANKEFGNVDPFDEKIMAAARMSESPAELQENIQLITKKNISLETATNLQDTLQKANLFSPEQLSFPKASLQFNPKWGDVVSLDVVSLGAKNLSATAKAINEASDTRDLFKKARRNEQKITSQLNQLKDNVSKTCSQAMQGKCTVEGSGDDIKIYLQSQMTDAQKKELMTSLQQDRGSLQVRAVRTQVGWAGQVNEKTVVPLEEFEKRTRKHLLKNMSAEELDQVTFFIDQKSHKIDITPYSNQPEILEKVQQALKQKTP